MAAPRLTPEEVRLFKDVARQYPKMVEILTAWRTKELEILPDAINTNVGVLQGRVQVLTEVQKLFDPR